MSKIVGLQRPLRRKVVSRGSDVVVTIRPGDDLRNAVVTVRDPRRRQDHATVPLTPGPKSQRRIRKLDQIEIPFPRGTDGEGK